jgi:outer membrane protein
MNKIYWLIIAVSILLLATNFSAQTGKVKALTLDEMFRLVSENSKQLKLLSAGIETSRKATDLVKNQSLPSVNLSLSASYLGDAFLTDRNFSNFTNAPMPHFGNNFALEASQIVFAGGAISNSIEKAELEEQIAQLNYQREQMDVRFLLIGYYLDLFELMNQREIYVKNIEQTNLLIKQIKAKRLEGMALNNDVTRHELTLKNIELSLIEIDNNCKILNYHLTTALGLPSDTEIKPDSTILNFSMSAEILPDLMQTAKQSLPELKSATVKLQVAEKEINIAKANFLPSIALVAANHFDGPITIEVPPINQNLNYWYVGVGLKYNLSSLYTTKQNVLLAKKQQDMATDEQSVIEEQAMLAVQSSFIKYKESFDQLSALEKSLQLAAENYGVINYRYLNNLVLITEMLDASNTKLNAEFQVVNAKINIVFNYYKLQRTIGKL